MRAGGRGRPLGAEWPLKKEITRPGHRPWRVPAREAERQGVQAAAASQNEAEESDESAEDDGAGEREREKRERREWDDREVA